MLTRLLLLDKIELFDVRHGTLPLILADGYFVLIKFCNDIFGLHLKVNLQVKS